MVWYKSYYLASSFKACVDKAYGTPFFIVYNIVYDKALLCYSFLLISSHVSLFSMFR